MKLILAKETKPMPWKNGQGMTREIALDPPEADFPHGAFRWRLSSAVVGADSTFSIFPGCARWLAIIEGAGFELNGHLYSPLEVIEFSGDQTTHARLTAGPIKDLGVIYNPREVAVQGAHRHWRGSGSLPRETGEFLIYLVAGEVELNGFVLNAGDTLRFTGPRDLTWKTKTEASAFVFRITSLRPS